MSTPRCEPRATAFEGWRDTTPAERQRALLRMADAVEARADEIVEAECRNTGKPIALTRPEEMPPLVDELRFFAGAARMLEGKSAGEYLADHTSYVRREPIGVCAQVTPWNYPMMMAVWKFAPAIAAGNTVVLKPSDTTPVTTLLLAEIAAEFLPPGVLNVVCGDRDTGRAVVAHPTPQMVSITGSTRAGMEVAAAAAPDLKRTHLELGGKAPVVVFDDVDIEAAAAGIAGAGFFNAGQDCTAACRVLVSRADRRRLHRRAGRGGPRDQGRRPVRSRTRSSARSTTPTSWPGSGASWTARPDHAEIVAGGARIGARGYFFEPTVVAGLRQDDEMVQDEIFGPVITVQRFADEDQAVRWANDVRVRAGRQRLDPRPRPGDADARSGSTSARSGSTRTSRSSPRCRTAASSTPATARTCPCTGSRTTRGSSTSCSNIGELTDPNGAELDDYDDSDRVPVTTATERRRRRSNWSAWPRSSPRTARSSPRSPASTS